MYLPGDLAKVIVECAVWTAPDYRVRISHIYKDEVVFILSKDSGVDSHSYYVITSNAVGWMWGPNLQIITV